MNHFTVIKHRVIKYDCVYDYTSTFTDEQHELLRSAKAEQESLLQEVHTAKQHCNETQVSVLTSF